MMHIMPPEQAFLERLSISDRSWLAQLWQHAQQPPPAHWVRWCMSGSEQEVGLGFLSPGRALWLRAHLRHLAIGHMGQILWSAGEANCNQRSTWLGEVLQTARRQQLVSGWRDELYAWWHEPSVPPTPEHSPEFVSERAGFRYLGLLSHAVHINGFMLNGDLWCAQRAVHKSIDPGLLDNLAAGGLTAGESPLQAAIRELHEEAGLQIDALRLMFKGSVRTCRIEPEGWHNERLLVFNLALGSDESPCNLDGEVQDFECLTPDQVVTRIRNKLFTLDSAVALACGLGLTPPSIR